MVRVCFVCLGNICRSPTAEGVMRHLVDRAGLADQIEIDSAGTGAWHAGEPADARARESAARRGLRLDSIARQVTREDFDRFNYLVAMDRANVTDLERMAPGRDVLDKILLLRAFDARAPAGAGVPDPYYGGETGFEEVLDICEAACRGFLEYLAGQHQLAPRR
jgi:protein-tyrosine phosphatase